MIVSFSVSNFRSFLGEETLSLVASNRLSGSHDGHATPIPHSDEKVLRSAVIYGANGAGKSNLFKALQFLKVTALRQREKNSGTGRQAFRFSGSPEEPSTFDLQFVVQEKLYRFGFKANDQRIVEEWLVQVDRSRERVIYERTTDGHGKVTVNSEGLKSAGEKLKALATVGGPQNQSFLATIGVTLETEDYGEELSEIIRWFDARLILISPSASFAALKEWLADDSSFNEFAGDFLRSSSTGIDRLDVVKNEITESELKGLLSEEALTDLLSNMARKQQTTASVKVDEMEFLVERAEENHYYRVAIQAAHQHAPGKTIPLELSEESDGTRRLLNLIPALYDLPNSPDVYFIDEIDRSLHPLLIWKFLEYFLKSCPNGQQQIIVTTHESNLLDLELLRRDEIWFAEKDEKGATHLYSLSDFRVRKDLEIRKHYLHGRFGAVPFLGTLDRLLQEQSRPHESCPSET